MIEQITYRLDQFEGPLDLLLALIQKNKSATLATNNDQYLFQPMPKITDLVVEHPAARYIVRRLTPTECARLQGFPDEWAHPDYKTELTDEEYLFWLNVRNTHAAINGKAVKQYTREQMLRWYNGLHTDSAEYKLWGNGIALPCALYVMEGIAEELEKEEDT
jgi:DNA (cytosine-5)-methyltransferase 1